MLQYLSIRNVAVIESVEIEFEDGLNILTGETGAGKSIVIDSVNLALGERADKNMIRTGTDKAVVQGVFDLSKSPVSKALLKGYFDIDDNELVVIRELSANGRNVCKINGNVATLMQLKSITSSLVDIHGQHEHQSLLDEANHIKVVDGFSGEELASLKNLYRQKFHEYIKTKEEIESMQLNELERQRQIEMYQFQIREIDEAKLQTDEDNILKEQRQLLISSEDIKRCIDNAHFALSGSEEGASISMLVQVAYDNLAALAEIDKTHAPLASRLEELIIELDDISDEVRILERDFDFDLNDLEEIENRLMLLKRLSKKYGSDVNEIIVYRKEIGERLLLLDEHEIILDELERREKSLYDQCLNIAVQMSEIRKSASMQLRLRILEQLADLGMENSEFETQFVSSTDENGEYILGKKGIDNVRFLISTNLGEDVKPLRGVVSGGELSRIMLVLKSITAQIDDIDTLIFDEIDTGISGEMARVVGEKLAVIASGRQVICVTHSAQIAALSDNHLFISKKVEDNKTKTLITKLDIDQRYKEISRLVGGTTMSYLSDEHAKQIIHYSNEFKQKYRS
ncbi:MAG: DNA repair protein RecN [Clostridia bacterium]|nr:DNA repair protein RecN [Clostridia bacterium]